MLRAKNYWINFNQSCLITLATSLTLGACLSGCGLVQASGQQSDQNANGDWKADAASTEHQGKEMLSAIKRVAFDKKAPLSSSPETVNVNYADEDSLTTLPGITPARARQIVNNRPYATPQDMVAKGILTKAQYAQIAGHVVAFDN